MDQFNNATQAMWSNFLDSDIVKDIVDIGAWLIKAIDRAGVLNSALIALATVSMVKNKMGPISFFKGLIEAGTQGITKLTDYAKGLKNVTFETSELSNAKATLTQAQLKEKLANTGLTDSVAEEIVTKTNLGKATDELSASTLDATLREAGYSKEKREAIIQSVFNTQATDDNTQANKENAASNMAAGAAEDKETQDTKENTIATQQDTAATRDNTQANKENAASNVTLGQKIKNLGSSVGSFIKQNAATFIAIGTTLLTIGLTKLVDAIVKTMDEANEEFQEAASELESLNSELQNLESQLEDVNDQIAELINQTPISFTDQEELSRLQAQSAELQRQIDLTETLKENASIKANDEAMQAAEKYENVGVNSGKTTGEIVGDTTKVVGGIGIAATGAAATLAAVGAINSWNPVGWVALAAAAVTAIAAGIATAVGESEEKVGESMDNMKERFATLQEEYNTARTNYRNDPTKKNKEKYEEAQKALNDYKASMSEYMLEMDAYYQTIRNNWDTATTEQKQAAIDWADQMDAYAIASGGQNAKANAINKVFSDGELMDKFTGEKALIDEYVKALEDGDASAAQAIANIINDNQELKDAFSAKTLDPQDAIDYFVQIGQAANYATIEGKVDEIKRATGQLGNAFKNIDQFMTDGKVDKVAIAEYFVNTSDKTQEEIARLVQGINDGKISVDHALKQFELFGVKSVLDIEITEVQTNFKDVFTDLEDADGLIDTFQELADAIGSTSRALDSLNAAQAEMKASGRVSIETALKLMESTDDYSKVLTISNGKLVLAEGAEENLIEARISSMKASALAALEETQNAKAKAITSKETAITALETYNSAIETEMAAAVTATAWDKVLAAAAGLWAGIKSLFTDESWTEAYDRVYQETLNSLGGDRAAKVEAKYNSAEERAKKSELEKSIENADKAIEELEEEEKKRQGNYDLVSGLTKDNIGDVFKSDGFDNPDEVEDDTFQREMDYWENRIQANQARADRLQGQIDLLEQKGMKASADYYRDQMTLLNSVDPNDGVDSKLELLQGKLDTVTTRLGQVTEGSEEWWEAAQEYNDIVNEIQDIESAIVDMQDAIGEIDTYKFEEFNTRISNLTGQLDELRGLLADEDEWFNDQGEWTEDGVAVLGTYVQELQIYKNALDDAKTELKKYQKAYAGNESAYAEMGIHSEQEYYERLTAAQDQYNEYLGAIDDTEDAVVDMYEAQIDAVEEYIDTLVDAYSDYIDSVKDALSAERDLYDFKKGVQKESKNIAEIERKIASLSNSTNASDIATKRKLEAELVEAKEALNDTYYDHAKQSQEDALSAEQEAYEETMNRFVENLRAGLDAALFDMDNFISGVTTMVTLNADTVLEKYQTNNPYLSKELTDPWSAAIAQSKQYEGDALALLNRWVDAGGDFNTLNTTIGDELQSPWEAGSSAVDLFKQNVDTQMDSVLSKVESNVQSAKSELADLYAEIKSTAEKVAEIKGEDPPENPAYNPTPDPTPTPTPSVTTPKNTTPTRPASPTRPKFKKVGDLWSGVGHTGVSIGKKTYNKASEVEGTDGIYYPYTNGNGYAGYIKKGEGYTVLSNGKIDIHSFKPIYQKYAKGATDIDKDQLAIVDELGPELMLRANPTTGRLDYVTKGTGIVPADATSELMKLADIGVDGLMMPKFDSGINMMTNYITKPEFKIDIEEFVHVERVDQDTLPKLEAMMDKKINDFSRALNYSIKKFAR